MTSFSSRDLLRLALLVAFAAGCAHKSAASPDASGGQAAAKPTPGQSVTSRDAQRSPSESVEKMLEGRFPGVNVIRTPEGGLRIGIRGATSFRGDNAPLYVIDGVPTEPGANGDLTGINPYDIESIKVHTDAATTTMYGVRGANGVIIIKTKRS